MTTPVAADPVTTPAGRAETAWPGRSVLGTMKRFGEWYLASAGFRAEAGASPEAAAARYGLDLDPAQARALLRPGLLADGADLTGVPDSVVAFRDYRRAALLRASRWRTVATGAAPRFHAWRQRQLARCEVELGRPTGGEIESGGPTGGAACGAAGGEIGHAPVAVELQKGCSAGCWFCGVSAPALDGMIPYAGHYARLWAEVIGVLREVCGDALASGILHWCTDPLDNPDYEHFLAAWEERVGYAPVTTTAQPIRYPGRIRALVERSAGDRAGSLRISVLSIGVLRRLFAAYSPGDLLGTELVMQMPGASTPLARAGRAADAPFRRGSERLEPGGEAAVRTVAPVSGFLVNMVDRSVRMITPRRASERWPDGYEVLGQGSFTCGDDLRMVLARLIADNAAARPAAADRLRFPALSPKPAAEGAGQARATIGAPGAGAGQPGRGRPVPGRARSLHGAPWRARPPR